MADHTWMNAQLEPPKPGHFPDTNLRLDRNDRDQGLVNMRLMFDEAGAFQQVVEVSERLMQFDLRLLDIDEQITDLSGWCKDQEAKVADLVFTEAVGNGEDQRGKSLSTDQKRLVETRKRLASDPVYVERERQLNHLKKTKGLTEIYRTRCARDWQKAYFVAEMALVGKRRKDP